MMQIITGQTDMPDDAVKVREDGRKLHHYADGVAAEGFLRLFAAKMPSLLKSEVGD